MTKTLLLTLAAFATVNPARGVIILADQFSYPNGPLVMAPGSLWQAHGTGTPVQVTNEQIRVSLSADEDVSAFLAGRPYHPTNQPSVTSLYASFKATFTTLPSGQGSFFAHFQDDNDANFRGRIYALTNGVTTVGKFRLAVASTNAASTSAGLGLWPSDLSTGVTYVVVTRIDVATGASQLWINPSAEGDTSVSTTAHPGAPIRLSMYAFRQTGGIGNSLIDDLRVGTSFADALGGNNPPTISSITAQSTAANTAIGPIAFSIRDAETAANDLTLLKDSSNTALIPLNNIVFGGSGSNRTVTIIPALNQQGTGAITVSVSDGLSLASAAFLVAVGLPSISSISDQQTPVNTPTAAIPFTVGDAETLAGSLTLTAASANTGLLPNENIVFGGTGSNRTVVITPAVNQSGLVNITVTVNDGVVSAEERFVVTVFPNPGLLQSDDFNRPNGPVVDLTGTWLHLDGTQDQIQLQGNQLKITGDGDQDVGIELPGAPLAPTSGTILYTTFTVDFTELPSNAGSYFAHFRDQSQGFRCRVFATRTGAATGRFRLGIANNSATINSATLFPRDLSTGATYTVVTRYNVGSGLSRLWVDPASESEASVDAIDDASLATIYLYAFRQSAGIGSICIDDFKMGSSFASILAIQPRLQIVLTGTGVEISWPVSAEGFDLQGSATFASWADVTETPTVVGERKVVNISRSTEDRFFRLEK
jgi:hypothetical protein